MTETLQAKLNRLRIEATRVEEALRQEEQRQASMTIEQKVAEELHRIKCHINHIDSCDWERADVPTKWGMMRSTSTLAYSRRRYVEEAQRLLQSWKDNTVMSDDSLVLVLRLIE